MAFSREKLTKMLVFISTLAFCVATVSVILNGVHQFKVGSQLASISQVSNLAHVLVRQQANLFSLMLIKNTKSEELAEALDNFSKEEFVLDANLYAATGELLAQSKNAEALKERLVQKNTQQIVEPIFAKQALVGFLRVTFDAQYEDSTQVKVNKLFQQLYGELIILVLTGILFSASVFYYLRRKLPHTRTTHKATLPVLKTQAKRFHSRRRNFRSK
nr:YtjB family periplasmic protein [uncultured Haemophilus sp.]